MDRIWSTFVHGENKTVLKEKDKKTYLVVTTQNEDVMTNETSAKTDISVLAAFFQW